MNGQYYCVMTTTSLCVHSIQITKYLCVLWDVVYTMYKSVLTFCFKDNTST